jgi:ABC-type transporter Mla MlaB component
MMVKLDIEVYEERRGFVARLIGDLVAETTLALVQLERSLVTISEVIIDLSGVTTLDDPGLEALMHLVKHRHDAGAAVTFEAGEPYLLPQRKRCPLSEPGLRGTQPPARNDAVIYPAM